MPQPFLNSAMIMFSRRALLVPIVSILFLGEAMSAKPAAVDQLSSQHRFFVGMHHGTFAGDAQAIAAARLPPGSVAKGEFGATEGSRILAFKSPPGTTDTLGLEILILQPASSSGVHLWMSGTDLARPTRGEADDDVENFKDIGGGTFQVFERR